MVVTSIQGFMQKIKNPFPFSTGKLDVLGIHFKYAYNKPPVTNIPDYPLKSSQHCSMGNHTGNCRPYNMGTNGPILANIGTYKPILEYRGTYEPILANMGIHELILVNISTQGNVLVNIGIHETNIGHYG